MKCPNCSYGMQFRNAKHSSVDEIRAALEFFDGIERITITGGEATAHPKFDDISMIVRSRFPKAMLGLETNATLYPRWQNSLPLFDSIDASHYTADSWEGCPDNSKQIHLLLEDYPKLRILEARHVDMSHNKGNQPCGRQKRAHWSHGLIYGCCAATGVKGAIGIPLQKDWHKILEETPLPCGNCIYGQPVKIN